MSHNHDHENEVTYFAKTNFRNSMTKFGIKTDDRRRHVYVIGKTGMGKTTLLENFILSDIYAGHGCCYVDPHGDTAEKLIDYIPSWRINDVIYFNPSDVDFPIGFNILEAVSERHKHLVASGMMGVFKKIWENMWSSRMEYILNNTILALLDNPGQTLLGINRMLSEEEFRNRIVGNVSDPVVKQFWLKEFASYNDKYAQEAVAPIQNKIGQFLSASVIRNIVAQVKSTIQIRDIMDSEKIFIINLSKGRIGEDNSRLLGGLLITKLQLAAMERVDVPEKDRKDFYLYVDEFQNFAVESFAGILSEARKYRLCLTMAHQYIAQLTDEVREAVFGNVGTIISYRVGSPDGLYMEKEFAPRFMPEDIINLPKYNVYLKLLIDGVSSQPFSAITLPPISKRTGSEERVIRVSRERYANPRKDIEDKILKWSGMENADMETLLKEADEKKKMAKTSRKPRFEYNCTRCDKQIVLAVELDRSRPIYCEKCIEIVREERKHGKPKTKPLPRPSGGEVVERVSQEPAVKLNQLKEQVKKAPVSVIPSNPPNGVRVEASQVQIKVDWLTEEIKKSIPTVVTVQPTAAGFPPAVSSRQISPDKINKKRKRNRKNKQTLVVAERPPSAPSVPLSGSLRQGQTIKFE
ncbi:type IV secretion system DNA-binding domain-containing protein [Candidatus Uhrbacteria bacterium]|nr:type IV secretion system DNA-binding domain-containing protein [Candidatus Uhrbacteria bacterium]